MWNRLKIKISKSITGYVFIMPFIIGFIAFFLYPFFLSFRFSISELEIVSGGYNLINVGFQNYYDALFVNEDYLQELVNTSTGLLRDVPLIILFSLFISVILNQKFKGRLFARLLFFLPVVMASGIVLQMESMDYMTQTMGGEAAASSGTSGGILGGQAIRAVFYQLKLPQNVLDYIMAAVQGIPDIIKASGIQILVFLAGLQSIPGSLYEAAKVEGATAWENFWKITLPLISPLILTNILYTIIDSYMNVTNPLFKLINDTAFSGMGFGISSAMSWVFFLVVAIILAISLSIVSRWVFYQE